MANIRINLDEETFHCLLKSALAELRPVDAQVAVILRRALGLTFPYPYEAVERTRECAKEAVHVAG